MALAAGAPGTAIAAGHSATLGTAPSAALGASQAAPCGAAAQVAFGPRWPTRADWRAAGKVWPARPPVGAA